MREYHRQIRVAAERRLPDKTLVEHAAERVDVRSPIDLLAGDPLGRHIVDGAQKVAVVADSGLLGDSLREAEVREVDVVGAIGAGARVEQHVGGLHVAMHEAAYVGRIESARHLSEEADRVRRVEAAVPQALPRSLPST